MKFSSSGDRKPIAVAATPAIPEQRMCAFMDLPVEIHQRIIAEVRVLHTVSCHDTGLTVSTTPPVVSEGLVHDF